MDLTSLLSRVVETPSLGELAQHVQAERQVTASVVEGAKGAVIAALFHILGLPIVVVVPKPQRAEALVEELAAWQGGYQGIYQFPEREAIPYDPSPPDPSAVAKRLRALYMLCWGEKVLIVASALALAQRTISAQELGDYTVSVATGGELEPRAFLGRLQSMGYQIVPTVEVPGEASRRGGIVDVFPPTTFLPVRIELWGRQVDEIRYFDPATQRSTGRVERVTIIPACEAIFSTPPPWCRDVEISHLPEHLRDRMARELASLANGEPPPGLHFYVPFLAHATLLDHLPPHALLVIDEEEEVVAALKEAHLKAQETVEEMAPLLPKGLPSPLAPVEYLTGQIKRHPRALTLTRWPKEEAVSLPFSPAPGYGGQLRRLASELLDITRRGGTATVVSQQALRLKELLQQEGIDSTLETSRVTLVHGSLPAGWRLEDPPLLLLTDREIFGFAKERRPAPRRYFTTETTLAQLSPGDYVVHIDHGIARFAGVVRSKVDGVEREYLELQYAEGDKLLVPVEQVDRISRYVGPSGFLPPLTRLGSGEWQRIKRRVREAVTDLAKELLSLYAAREVLPGYAFPHDTPWQLELEASFPYLETPDQLAALAEVKRDMESPRPMDRLICGDVGYGKTEIALRAAFKAVMGGKQVAFLVPTTILAQQHYQTFLQRLTPFPVTVAMLSRLLPDKEQEKVIRDLAQGSIDIVIGTHRLLQPDVSFRDLGLVIVDEEQRFGVVHKEHLKRLRLQVDVLTLSATPIPRTLYMALGGIRDMSLLETPPESRLPVRTIVAPYQPQLVKEAIRRELARGGQVYYVHNRIKTIHQAVQRAKSLVPEARVAVAHGQMDEEELAIVMDDFRLGKVDVLVCTTIVESGLDIPNANTIIIEDAHRLGLSQLYQLRGRVGRSEGLGYAYIFYPPEAHLTEAAERRLQAIFEASQLGAGFQIALRDLEIRGAGNLLGPEQSGHMAAVGLELYSRLLQQATQNLRAQLHGESPPLTTEGPDLIVDLPLSAYLPESFVPNLGQRLALYQRLAEAPTPEEVDSLALEMADRFGPPPEPAQRLIFIARLRAMARQLGIRSLALEGGKIVARWPERRPHSSLPPHVHQWVDFGPTTMRIDPVRLGDEWPKALEEALRSLFKG